MQVKAEIAKRTHPEQALRVLVIDIDECDYSSAVGDPSMLDYAVPDDETVISISTVLAGVNYSNYRTLMRDAQRIKSSANREAALNLIESARCNADETIYVEHAATEADWASLFRGSLESLLSCERYEPGVIKFFANRDIAA